MDNENPIPWGTPSPNPPQPTQKSSNPWKYVAIIVGLLFIGFIFSALSSSDDSVQNRGHRDFSSTAKVGEYGSDATLDRLYDRCDDGDMSACTNLYWDSPLGSDYEDFAQQQRQNSPSSDEIPERIQERIMEQIWRETSSEDRRQLCMGRDFFGEREFARMLIEESNQDYDLHVIMEHFREKCG